MKVSTVRCHCCGKFVPGSDIQSGKAKQTFVPDNHFSGEQNLTHCRDCSIKHGKPIATFNRLA